LKHSIIINTKRMQIPAQLAVILWLAERQLSGNRKCCTFETKVTPWAAIMLVLCADFYAKSISPPFQQCVRSEKYYMLQ
jgi:hypothetical protein